MRNIRLDLAYDGTNYSGYQIQPNGISIEEVLRKALDKKNIDYQSLAASGRTDAGVHANSHTVNFKTNSTIPGDRFKYALNSVLPDDVRVISSTEVEDDFHARYSSVGKHYIYTIDLSKIQLPLNRLYSWNYPFSINKDKLFQASEFLAGEHDFNAFMASGSSIKDTVREIFLIKPVIKDDIIEIHFIGNGFLYNMVRILTGTIIQTAAEQYDIEKLSKVFEEPIRENAGITAPAKGLRLEKVFYSQEELEKTIKDIKLL